MHPKQSHVSGSFCGILHGNEKSELCGLNQSLIIWLAEKCIGFVQAKLFP